MIRKINILNILIYIVFIVIIGRLYFLQIIKHDYYLELLDKLNNKEVEGDVMPRGKIYDKNGVLLVDNTLVKTIYYKKVDKISVDEEIKLAYQIKDYLELDYSKLTNSYLKDFYILTNENEVTKRLSEEEIENHKRRKISDNDFYKLKKSKVTNDDLSKYNDDDKKAIYLYYLMNNGYSYDDKIIKTNATDEEFAYFSESNFKLKGFDTKYTYDRYYYYDDTLKSIFGGVGAITSENKDYYLEKGYSLNDTVGLSNLEYVYDDYLKGKKEIYRLNGDEKILVKEGKTGKDLYLTIDIKLQQLVDKVLETEIKNAKMGVNTKYFDRSYVTISDPNDGSILAISGKLYQNGKMMDYGVGTFTDTMASGSVVKGASILTGYSEGAVQIGEGMIDECIKIRATPKKCSIYTMGYVNDLSAIAKSSNVYQFKIALRIGGVKYRYDAPAVIKEDAFDIYRNYFSKFGLGVKTGIELPKESEGYKGSGEDAGLLMNFAIGQYDTYTNIQLNQYIATIANGKNRYQLHLLSKIQDKDEVLVNYEPVILNEIGIKDEYIKRLKQALKLVLSEGTGRGYIDLALNPSGKTGTSETFVDSNNDKKYETESISTAFVAYFPSDNPKYALAISTPNISYINNASSYIYPFNKIVIRKITDSMN